MRHTLILSVKIRSIVSFKNDGTVVIVNSTGFTQFGMELYQSMPVYDRMLIFFFEMRKTKINSTFLNIYHLKYKILILSIQKESIKNAVLRLPKLSSIGT